MNLIFLAAPGNEPVRGDTVPGARLPGLPRLGSEREKERERESLIVPTPRKYGPRALLYCVL